MGRNKWKWQEKGSVLSKQRLHQGLIHQAPNLLAHAVFTSVLSFPLQRLLVFIARPTPDNFSVRSAWGRVPTAWGGLCDAVAGTELTQAPLGMLRLGKED